MVSILNFIQNGFGESLATFVETLMRNVKIFFAVNFQPQNYRAV